jgi:hypothetical protein
MEPDRIEVPADLSPEQLAKAVACMEKIADVCQEFDRATVLLALENAYVAEVILASPMLGRLLEQTINDYKKRALSLLRTAEALEQAAKDAGTLPPEGMN